jgi:hypothetical protein
MHPTRIAIVGAVLVAAGSWGAAIGTDISPTVSAPITVPAPPRVISDNGYVLTYTFHDPTNVLPDTVQHYGGGLRRCKMVAKKLQSAIGVPGLATSPPQMVIGSVSTCVPDGFTVTVAP